MCLLPFALTRHHLGGTYCRGHPHLCHCGLEFDGQGLHIHCVTYVDFGPLGPSIKTLYFLLTKWLIAVLLSYVDDLTLFSHFEETIQVPAKSCIQRIAAIFNARVPGIAVALSNQLLRQYAGDAI